MKIPKRFLKRILFVLLFLLIFMNVVAYIHAYKFTHFDLSVQHKTQNPESLSFQNKIKTLLLGVNNPKPQNKKLPEEPYKTLPISVDAKQLEAWKIPAKNAVGTVLLFHGYGGEKSSMLDKAEVFRSLGYSTVLVDFIGSGGSEGNTTSIGFNEAKQVKAVYDAFHFQQEDKVVLFGTSMGAVAIMKALNDYTFRPTSIIIECLFGTMLETVKARFKTMGVPTFPMAHLLVFWGGIQNGYNAFQHNPETYAKNINTPTLLLYGEQDQKVSLDEIKAIYNNLKGPKTLRTYPKAGHENYLTTYPKQWKEDVELFL